MSQKGGSQLRVTMLLYGEIEGDSRVRREVGTLVECGYEVTVATLATERRRPFTLDGATIVPLRPGRQHLMPGDESPFRHPEAAQTRLSRGLARGRWAAGYGATFAYWARAALNRLGPADVWHGHDFLGLLAAWSLRRRHGGALVHDSHELYLEAGSAARLPGPARAALARIEGRASRAADAVITVNEAIAGELRRRYGVDPVVIMNCPVLRPPPAELVLRERLGLGDRKIAIYHGVLGPGRGIEHLIDAIPYLPSRAVVVLLGRGPLASEFAALAAAPARRDRLFVVPAVPIHEVTSWIADADVGVIPFQAVDRNNVLGTPNKLFEYLEAAVPMVVSDFPEMRRIVAETGAGVAVDASTPESLGAGIASLMEEPAAERAARRAAGRRAAETTYNWARQADRLVAIYAGLGERAARR